MVMADSHWGLFYKGAYSNFEDSDLLTNHFEDPYTNTFQGSISYARDTNIQTFCCVEDFCIFENISLFDMNDKLNFFLTT